MHVAVFRQKNFPACTDSLITFWPSGHIVLNNVFLQPAIAARTLHDQTLLITTGTCPAIWDCSHRCRSARQSRHAI